MTFVLFPDKEQEFEKIFVSHYFENYFLFEKELPNVQPGTLHPQFRENRKRLCPPKPNELISEW